MPQTQTQIAADFVAAISTSTPAATNFNVGSLIRSLADTSAAEDALMEAEIESQVANAIINAVAQWLPIKPTGSTGSTYLMTFTLSSSATTSKTYTIGTAVTIPNSSLQWETGQTFTLAPGQSQNVTVVCTTAGTISNVPANTITQLVIPDGYTTVTNASGQPIVQGRNAETQTEIQAQVANASNLLHRGDESAVEAGALTSALYDASGNPTEQVVKAREVDSNTNGLGYCFVYNGSGAMSSALLTFTQQVIDGYTDTNGIKHTGYKAAGVTMTVQDAPQTSVDVTVAVLPKYGFSMATVTPNVQRAVDDFFANLDLGQSLSLGQLYTAISLAPGVDDSVISDPSATLPAVPYVSVPSTPSLTAVTPTTATNLAAAAYEVALTFTNEWGETTASTTASVTLTQGQAVQVGAITLPVGASGINYYMPTVAGGTTLALDTNGDGSQIDITVLPASGAASLPSSNTAEIQGNAYILGTLTINPLAS